MTDLGKAAAPGAGVHWFVAWRYLLARPRKLSGPILAVTALCLWMLAGFTLGILWYPLADELMSPFAVMPWWLLIGTGLAATLVVIWPLVIGVRYVIYSRAAGPVRRLLRLGFLGLLGISALIAVVLSVRPEGLTPLWVGLGLWALWLLAAALAGALSRHPGDAAPSLLLVPILGGLAALALFAVFDYFHRPYGAAGPEPLGTGLLVAGGAALMLLVISLPCLVVVIARRERNGMQGGPRRRRASSRAGAVLREVPEAARRYVVWGLLGVDLAILGLLVVGAGYGVSEVLWPARALVAGGELFGVVALASLILGAFGLGVAAALRRRPIGAIAVRAGLLALVIGLLAAVIIGVLYVRGLAFSDLPSATRPGAIKLPLGVNIPMLVAGSLLLPTIILAAIRYFFTFFSTVSIGGVAIGSMALVIVLSVMSGFENDLRNKILGSNAHMLITKAPDDPMICKVLPELRWKRCVIDVDHVFTEYREVGAIADQTPGVIASSPYLISEVVIAANNNYANVIIKGVDPETVGQVSELQDNVVGSELEPPEFLGGFTLDLGDLELPISSETVRRTLMHFGVDPDHPTSAQKRPLDKLYPLSPEGEVIGKPEPGAGPPGPEGPPIEFPGPDSDAPPDLDLPGDPEPVDLSGGADPDDPPLPDLPADPEPLDLSGGPDAGLDAGREIDIITDLDHMPPLDDELGPPIAREGLHEAAQEFTAAIPPRVAILPGVLVGKELVKQINLYDGQEVKIVSPLGQDTPLGPVPRTKPFRVAGVFYTGMYEYDLKYIYVEFGALQDFLDLGDEVTGIEVRVSDPEHTGDVVAALNERLGPAYEVADWKSLNRSLFSALKLEKIAMFLVLAIIILVASFSIVGNLIMVVIEKAREIAVIKTLGASDSAVMQIFVTQGFFIGLVGTGVGVSLGLAACWAGIHFGLPLDPDVYYIDKLPIHVEPTSVMLVAAAGIVISVVATLYPAYIAARLRPIRGLRYE